MSDAGAGRAALAELLDHLRLERLEHNLFRGVSRDIGNQRVFGGQVLAQALYAATQTVDPASRVHSLHGYFLRPGDVTLPIVFDVDRSRDGRRFTARRTVAVQRGEQILNMACSFHREEAGLEHQDPMPDVPPPEALADQELADRRLVERAPVKLRKFLAHMAPFTFKPVEPLNLLRPEQRAPLQHMWVRTVGDLPDDQGLQRCLLTYVSDYYLIGTATLPHGVSFMQGRVQLASLDHAMWFHRDVRLDDWLLFRYESPSASHARGLARSSIFSRDGRLIASTAQEGLVRVRSRPEAGGGQEH